jgi:hypothetical protein
MREVLSEIPGGWIPESTTTPPRCDRARPLCGPVRDVDSATADLEGRQPPGERVGR